MRYLIAPGLYRIGKPEANSPVLVTANYKLTVDTVRRWLAGMNVWLLVLDTKGVNVWCAAGKGTFGTAELVRRIETARLRAAPMPAPMAAPMPAPPAMAPPTAPPAAPTGVRIIQ